MKPKVYIETSVVSYQASRPSTDLIVAAHQRLTQEWWEASPDRFDRFVSQTVIREAAAGDPEAAKERLESLEGMGLLELSEGAYALAAALVARGALPAEAPEDALHIAVATVHGMDYLVTWNCAHIANAQLRCAVEEVCRSLGYEPPIICTPEELMGG